MRQGRLLGALVAVLAFAPGFANAQWVSYAAKPLNLRAGPAQEYPLVARVAAGMQISVQGCLDGYRWCDVVAGPYRGWAYAHNIYLPYQGANVPLLNYGPAIGVGIVGFAVGSYWDEHYRERPWYHRRQYWIDRPAPGYRHIDPRPDYRPEYRLHDHRPPDRPHDYHPHDHDWHR